MTDSPDRLNSSGALAFHRKVPAWFWRDVLLPFLTTRFVLVVIAWIAFHVLPLPSAFPLSWEIGAGGAFEHTTRGAPRSHSLINMWSRWDAGWYLDIAKRGYHYEPGKPSSVAFFPLYPAALRLLHDFLFLPASDGSYLVTGIALSNICLIISVVYLRALLLFDYNAQVTRRVLLFLLLFPTNFFFSAVYSESLFLLLSVSSLFYARKQRWVLACALAALASLSRSQGIILIAPLLVEYLAQRQWKLQQLRRNMAAFLLIPAAVIALCCYLSWSFGNWTVFFKAQQPWGRRFLAPWYTFRWVSMHASAAAGVKNDWIDLAFFALLVIATVFSICKLRLSYVVYLCAAIALFSSWGMLGSVPRFILVIFPLFIVLALFAERYVLRVVYLAVSSALSALFFIMFSQWQWVA